MKLYISDYNLDNLNEQQKEDLNFEIIIYERTTFFRFQSFCATCLYLYLKNIINNNIKNYQIINENANFSNILNFFNSIKLREPHDQTQILILLNNIVSDNIEILLSLKLYGLIHIIKKIKYYSSLFSVGNSFDILLFIQTIKDTNILDNFKFFNENDKKLNLDLFKEIENLCNLSIQYKLPIIIEYY